ncbi:MAG: hypothetical protein HY722_03940 [Planctomycetes bacterium]|nr:hypothetical protein [Planctomycetota bacterium]
MVSPAGVRPLRWLDPPVAVGVTVEAGGQPVGLCLPPGLATDQGHGGDIGGGHLRPPPSNYTGLRRLVGYGPLERIDAGAWEDQEVRRDYYQVEDEEGTRWWIYRDRRLTPGAGVSRAPAGGEEGGWYLQGMFA